MITRAQSTCGHPATVSAAKPRVVSVPSTHTIAQLGRRHASGVEGWGGADGGWWEGHKAHDPAESKHNGKLVPHCPPPPRYSKFMMHTCHPNTDAGSSGLGRGQRFCCLTRSQVIPVLSLQGPLSSKVLANLSPAPSIYLCGPTLCCRQKEKERNGTETRQAWGSKCGGSAGRVYLQATRGLSSRPQEASSDPLLPVRVLAGGDT